MYRRSRKMHEQSNSRPSAFPLDPSGKTAIIVRAKRELDFFNRPAENEDAVLETVGGSVG